jgi:hypothetical protein
MKPTIKEIALAFSGGKFEIAYPFLTDDTQWHIIGEKTLKGKDDIIKFCDQTAKYFSEVTTDFQMSNLVVGDDSVAIDGTATFLNKDNKKTFVSSCDVYRFEHDKLAQINSYCITGGKE